jgi:uncharacterized coiled-coil protein SlyX
MKNAVLLLAVFLCFGATDGFCNGKQDPRIENLQKEVAKLQTNTEQIPQLQQKIESLEKTSSSNAETLKEINKTLAALQVQVSSLEKKVDDLAKGQPPINGDETTGRSNRIMHNGSLKLEAVAGFIRSRNPNEKLEDIMELLGMYKELADREGVNYDIAIAQMCRSTNYLARGNNNYNYAEFNPAGTGSAVIKFRNKGEGVLAHIQHLKAYASPVVIPRNQLVDPRYDILEQKGYLNSVVTFDQLYAKWAPQNASVYRRDITEILTNLYKASDSHR